MSDRYEWLCEVLDKVLASWTALDLAIAHFDGNFRGAQDRRSNLLESVACAVRDEKYELEDIAEFINEYMYDEYHMELDDNSHFEIARVALDSWTMIKQGIKPAVAARSNGAACSVVQNSVEEVSDCDMDDEEMDGNEKSQSAPVQRVVTDEEGWSTIVPRDQLNR